MFIIIVIAAIIILNIAIIIIVYGLYTVIDTGCSNCEKSLLPTVLSLLAAWGPY